MYQHKKWDEYFPLVEFTYNNGYQDSLRMSPLHALYGRSCNTPISWSEPVNKVLIAGYVGRHAAGNVGYKEESKFNTE